MESKILIALLLLSFNPPLPALSDFWLIPNGPERVSSVDSLVSSMSDTELLGQVFMLGYDGTRPSRQFLSWIEDKAIGGVKIFGWNTGNLTELAIGIGEMQDAAAKTNLKIPLFVATDQEGGWVRHVKGETSITPGNIAIGASGIALDAYRSALVIGTELRILGINMNFAPNVDVYINPDAHVVGPRAFSSDPVDTAFFSLAFFKGLEKAGVICTAKHFPGHGNADEDSHGTLPIINDSFEEIWDRDLLPYRMLIKEGLPAIMTGHLSFPLISGRIEPTSLSPLFQRDILRDQLGFKGIVITDDMRMYGARQNGNDIATVCKLALLAGNDMIMISKTLEEQQEVWEYLYRSMKTDAELKNTIRESAVRIMTAKLKYLQAPGKELLHPDIAQVKEKIPDNDGKSYFFDLACRSTTIVKDKGIPLSVSKREKLLLVGQYPEFLEEGTSRLPDAEQFRFSYYGATPEVLNQIHAAVNKADIVLFCLSDLESLAVLKTLEYASSKIFVLSILTPIYLRETPWVESVIAVYGTGFESFKAGFAAFLGDFVPEGKLPLDIYLDGM